MSYAEASDLEARLAGLEMRFALLVIDTRDLVAIMRDEPSLIARRPHLAQEMAAMEVRLKTAYYASAPPPPRSGWAFWRRG